MKKAAVGLLAAAAMLAGCSQKDPSLQLSLSDIKSLCAKAGDAAFGKAREETGDKFALDWIEQGAAAQCELEYRIKQQEANKIF